MSVLNFSFYSQTDSLENVFYVLIFLGEMKI